MEHSSSTKNEDNVFILSWDCNGLESVIHLSQLDQMHEDAEKKRMWNTLETGEDPGNQYLRYLHHWISGLTMRARLNSQRNYEIYSVHVTPEITEQYMRDAFETDREHTIKLIRERGHKIYG